MLHIENLGKRYGDHDVFRGLTQHFSGGCVALCDEEQTGKSTLLAVLAGELQPDEGDVRIAGHSLRQAPQEARARRAWVPSDCLIHPALTGRELLERMAHERGTAIDPALQLARDLELDAHLDKRFDQMSTGTRRKVYLAGAVLGEPAVLLADGPTDGLDARARGVVAELFKQWASDGLVLFASHDAAFVRACAASVFSIPHVSKRP